MTSNVDLTVFFFSYSAAATIPKNYLF